MTLKALMAAAEKARRESYSPYSKFAVGAALLTGSGRVVTGCNVENSSFGLACCAERTAVFKAVSEGEREFLAVAITAGDGHRAAPCGACRQVLYEFSRTMWVYFRDGKGGVIRRRIDALLAEGFHLSEELEPKKAATRKPAKAKARAKRGAR